MHLYIDIYTCIHYMYIHICVYIHTCSYLCIYTHGYTYIYIYTYVLYVIVYYISLHCTMLEYTLYMLLLYRVRPFIRGLRNTVDIVLFDISILVTITISSHEFNSHKFDLRVSTPRAVACIHFNMPFES